MFLFSQKVTRYFSKSEVKSAEFNIYSAIPGHTYIRGPNCRSSMFNCGKIYRVFHEFMNVFDRDHRSKVLKSCLAHYVWYWIATCGLVWPYVALFDLMWPCMGLWSHLWPFYLYCCGFISSRVLRFGLIFSK